MIKNFEVKLGYSRTGVNGQNHRLTDGRTNRQTEAMKTIYPFGTAHFICQGPVVQSVVSLTSSLRVISLTVLAD